MFKRIFALILISAIVFLMLGVNALADSYTIDGSIYATAFKASQLKIPAIMYHKITDNPAEVTDYVVTGEMLANDFAEIKARGYSPITVGEYFELKKLAGNMFKDNGYKKIAEFFENNPKPIIITFDDGYEGIYTHALPLMKEYGFKASFFICGELIDIHNPEYCTWEEIRALNESGLAYISNHTYSLHGKPKDELGILYSIDFDYALSDINKNRTLIKNAIGEKNNVFSFPYGLYDVLLISKFKAAGYNGFVSTDYRANWLSDKQQALGRFNRPASFGTSEFFDLIASY